MGKAVAPTEKHEPLSQKKPKVKTTAIKHPQEQKKQHEKNWQKIIQSSYFCVSLTLTQKSF